VFTARYGLGLYVRTSFVLILVFKEFIIISWY